MSKDPIPAPLEFPDWRDHPPAPKMTFAQYQHWICHEIIPMAVARGEMTPEKLSEAFHRNEGSVASWPNFAEDDPLPEQPR